MLASMSEGHNCEDFEERLERSNAVNSKLSKDDVEKALQLQKEKMALADGNDTCGPTRQHVLKKVSKSVNVAVDPLINNSPSIIPSSNIASLQWTPKVVSSSAQKRPPQEKEKILGTSDMETFKTNKGKLYEHKNVRTFEHLLCLNKSAVET